MKLWTPVPHCRDCRTRYRPLRWRNLFDCWLCPRCETIWINIIVNQWIKVLTP